MNLFDRLDKLTSLHEAGQSAVCTRGETLHTAAVRVFGPDAYPDMYDEQNPERYVGVVSENSVGPCYGVFLLKGNQ